jgi:hypothetical protein
VETYSTTTMLNEGHTNPQIVAALKRLSFKTSTRSLKRCLQRWGRRRPAGTPGVRIGESRRRSPGMNAQMPPMTPLTEPPRRRLNRRNRRRRMPRTEEQVHGRVAGPPSQRCAINVQLQDAITVQTVPDSCSQSLRDDHSFNAKCLIPSSYSTSHCP